MEFNQKDEVHSSELRAGSRTYFFDVKETRSGEYYLTITESKKARNGQDHKERHRIFLYREDMEAFVKQLTEITDYTLDKQPIREEERQRFRNTQTNDPSSPSSFSDIEFDDL